MKYFKFLCGLSPEFPHNLRSDYIGTMREADIYCGYLARMYEFYFSATRTDNVSALTVYLIDKLPQNTTQAQSSSVAVFTVIDWVAFEQLTLKEKPLFIIELCHKAIIDLAHKASWNCAPFEAAFEKIKHNDGQFCDHWKKPVSSSDKQLKAQIYFEDDYERNGAYVDFTDKKGILIKRVQFRLRGYSVYCQNIGAIRWCDESHVKIYYIQTPRAGADYEGNTRDYWIIGTDGTAVFHYPRAEQVEPNSHGIFSLGVSYWNGTTIMQDKEKGLLLIKKSAELKYKHAQKWLEQNG